MICCSLCRWCVQSSRQCLTWHSEPVRCVVPCWLCRSLSRQVSPSTSLKHVLVYCTFSSRQKMCDDLCLCWSVYLRTTIAVEFDSKLMAALRRTVECLTVLAVNPNLRATKRAPDYRSVCVSLGLSQRFVERVSRMILCCFVSSLACLWSCWTVCIDIVGVFYAGFWSAMSKCLNVLGRYFLVLSSV